MSSINESLFGNKCQRGFVTIFFSGGSNPLNMWETHVQGGNITRSLDPELKTMILEIAGVNVSTTYMICPKGKQELGIYLPFLVMIVKNLHKYFTFEITVRDDSGFKRRFRVANFQSSTKIDIYSTAMPIGLADGWNQVQFNLADFTKRAYNKQFTEVVKVKINANIRLRRVYFAARLVPEEQLPPAYRLFYPLQQKKLQQKTTGKQEEVKADILPKTSTATVASAQRKSRKTLVGSGENRQPQGEDKEDQMSRRESKTQSSEKLTEEGSNIKEAEGKTKDEELEGKTSKTSLPISRQSSKDKDAGDVAERENEAVEVKENVPESENVDKVPSATDVVVEEVTN